MRSLRAPVAHDDDTVNYARHLLIWCRDYVPLTLSAAAIGLLLAILAVLEGFALQSLTARILSSDSRFSVFGVVLLEGLFVVALYPIIIIFRILLMYIFDMIQASLMIKCRDAIESRVLRLLLRSDQNKLQSISIGDLIGRLSVDLPRAMSYREQVISLFGAMAMIAAYTLFIGWHSYEIMIAILVISATAAFLNMWMTRSASDVDRRFREVSDGARVKIDEMIRSAKELRTNNLIEITLGEYSQHLHDRRFQFMRLSRYLARMRGSTAGWPAFAVWILISTVLIIEPNGPGVIIAPDVLPALLMVTIGLFSEFARVIEAIVDIRLIKVSINRLGGYAALYKSTSDWTDNGIKIPSSPDHFTYVGARYQYPASLRQSQDSASSGNRDFFIEKLTLQGPGLIAFTGPSGAGKSTAMDMLAKEVVPHSGRIELNGVSIDKIGRTAYSRKVSLLPQEPYLPRGRVVDLLSAMTDLPETKRLDYWNSDDRLLGLLTQSGLLDRLCLRVGAAKKGRSDEDGRQVRAVLSQSVEMHGAGLSGGEHQLIGLVRCLAGHASVLLLDEPTSALDSNSADRVITLLRQEANHRLIVCVTHSSLLATKCDFVCSFEAGRIVRFGPPE